MGRVSLLLCLIFCFSNRAVGLSQEQSFQDINPPSLREPKRSIWRHIVIGAISGAAAGFATDVSCYPIEAIKTRLQSGPAHHHDRKPKLSLIQSIMSLLSGVEVSMVASPFNYGLYFATYEPFKSVFEKALGPGMESAAYVAGATLATAVSFLTKVPSEVVKTRLMTGSDDDSVACMRRIVASEGLAGLFTGFWSLVLRELPFNVIEMVVYEHMRRVWSNRLKQGRDLVGWETCCVAAVCDGSVAYVTTPFDVIKTRLMDEAGSSTPHSLVRTTKEILRTDGLAGFMQGSGARVAYMGTGGIIFWVVLEEVQTLLRRWL